MMRFEGDAAYKRHLSQRSIPLKEELDQVLDWEIDNPARSMHHMEPYFDALSSRYCHAPKKPLPCKDEATCITEQHVRALYEVGKFYSEY